MADMPELSGMRIVVFEDEFFLAVEIEEALLQAGAVVIGPIRDASSIRSNPAAAGADWAVVDIDTSRGTNYVAVRHLIHAGVPLVMITGSDLSSIHADFADVPKLGKPIDLKLLLESAALAGARLQPSTDEPPVPRP
jgi:AmiR/NasT family two-component response regulator